MMSRLTDFDSRESDPLSFDTMPQVLITVAASEITRRRNNLGSFSRFFLVFLFICVHRARRKVIGWINATVTQPNASWLKETESVRQVRSRRTRNSVSFDRSAFSCVIVASIQPAFPLRVYLQNYRVGKIAEHSLLSTVFYDILLSGRRFRRMMLVVPLVHNLHQDASPVIIYNLSFLQIPHSVAPINDPVITDSYGNLMKNPLNWLLIPSWGMLRDK